MKNHIEFLGLPGSGKSTLYNELIDQKHNNLFALDKAVDISTKRAILNYQNHNKLKVIYRYLIYQLSKNFIYPVYKSNRFIEEEYRKFLINNPDLQKNLVYLFNEFDFDQQEKNRVFEWINKLIAEYSFLSNYLNKNESVLIDEGFIHRGIAYCLRNNSSYSIKDFTDKYIECSIIPDILIYVKVDIDIAIKRMKSRGEILQVLSTYSESEQRRRLNFAQEYINLVSKKLASKINIIEIDNMNSLESSINHLKKDLKMFI